MNALLKSMKLLLLILVMLLNTIPLLSTDNKSELILGTVPSPSLMNSVLKFED